MPPSSRFAGYRSRGIFNPIVLANAQTWGCVPVDAVWIAAAVQPLSRSGMNLQSCEEVL
jgi:hypothetical protein